MEEAILNFNKQFGYKPVIENADRLGEYKHYVLTGMGGSHLSADILKSYKPGTDLYVHKSYGLPPYDDEFFKDSLCIASSYSGNTEESIDFAEEAYSKGYAVAVISIGGKLIDFAKENNLPYIQIPDTNIQPRSALGFSLIALVKMLRKDDWMRELNVLENTLKPEEFREAGEELAGILKGKTPIIYSSSQNLAVAYNWKIKFNETGKIPAFYNIFPELNHNEMNGFDITSDTSKLGEPFHFIFLKDNEDDSRVQKRMNITEILYEERGLPVTSLHLEGSNRLERIFTSLLLADWAAVYTALSNREIQNK